MSSKRRRPPVLPRVADEDIARVRARQAEAIRDFLRERYRVEVSQADSATLAMLVAEPIADLFDRPAGREAA